MTTILVSHGDYATIQAHIDEGRKIAAIKKLRIAGASPDEERMGLREAKQAVEKMMGQNVDPQVPIVLGAPMIKRVVVDMGEGEVTIDLETMELLILKDVERLGLESCGAILDFVHTLKAWSEGNRIGVLDSHEAG